MKATEEEAFKALYPSYAVWESDSPNNDPAEELAVQDEQAVAEWKEAHV